MDNKIIIVLAFLFIINLISFLIMMVDKKRSRVSNDRIGEGIIFFWAIIFGSLGVYLGMFTFRHKTRKWYFIFGVPLLILQNISFIILIIILINKIGV